MEVFAYYVSSTNKSFTNNRLGMEGCRDLLYDCANRVNSRTINFQFVYDIEEPQYNNENDRISIMSYCMSVFHLNGYSRIVEALLEQIG